MADVGLLADGEDGVELELGIAYGDGFLGVASGDRVREAAHGLLAPRCHPRQSVAATARP